MPPTDHRAPSFQREIPPGDDRERSVCTDCGFIDYENPRIIVGSVVCDDRGQILLCKRAIPPQIGWWTLPAGFLESGETPEEGAMREAQEEAGADITIDGLLAVYTVRHLSQVQLFYRARLNNPGTIAPGPESLELMQVAYEDVPWTDLAFPTVGLALKEWHKPTGDGHNPPASTAF